MSFYALEAAKEAFEKTKTFFFRPFSLTRWLKIGFVGVLGGIISQGGFGGNCGNLGKLGDLGDGGSSSGSSSGSG